MTDDLLKDFPEPPLELIAQHPLAERDAARLMALNRAEGTIAHRSFRDLPSYFHPGDVLVLNDARVFPARLTAVKPTGGRVKLLLLERNAAGDRWTSLLTPAQKPGATFRVGEVSATVERQRDGAEYELAFSRPLTPEDLDRLGRMPLPPYIRRGPEDAPAVEAADREDYQTVFSALGAPEAAEGYAPPGAVAAPTAGLHFTAALLQSLSAAGVEVRRLRLDVGWGTFRPIRRGDYAGHRMMTERYHVPPETAAAVNAARSSGKGRVWAVGTTVVRTLESALDAEGRLAVGPGATDLYIKPGHRFRAVDALITNFHLRDHTPLVLAAAFAGVPLLHRAYAAAVREQYRFLSYGDGMLVT